jgi:uncharacterized protein (DUF362 family)
MKPFVDDPQLSAPRKTLRVRREDTPRRVWIERCREESESYEATVRCLAQLGGLSNIVKNGDVVMIKTNTSNPMSWATGANVDPQMTRAVVDLAFQAGASRVLVANASPGILESDVIEKPKMSTLEVYEFLGYREQMEAAGAELVDLNAEPFVEVAVPHGGLAFSSYWFSESVGEVDVLFSVAKMKTHLSTLVTLGIKNLIGMIPFEVRRGYNRWQIHIELDVPSLLAETPDDVPWGEKVRRLTMEKSPLVRRNLDQLHRVIADLCAVFPISLCVIDGVLAMDGDGPLAGDPKRAGLVIAGYNPVVTDAVATRLMGFEPESIPYFRYCAEGDLAEIAMDRIELGGLTVEEARCPFKPPSRQE